MNTIPVIIEKTFNAKPARVWKAITDLHDMKQWYFDIPEFEAEIGFDFQFIAGSETKKFLHICKITEIINGKKITYSWRYDGYAGNSFVTFELFPEGNKTKLRLTHEDLETFPSDNPDLAKENFVAGWNQIIGENLKTFVEKA